MTPESAAIKMDQEQALQHAVTSVAVITVTDQDSYIAAGNLCKSIVELEKEVHRYWDDTVQSANATWKKLVAKRAEFLDPLAKKKDDQASLMRLWEREQERIDAERQRQAEEAARKMAEDDALAAAAALEKVGTPEARAAAEQMIDRPEVPQVVVPKTTPKGYGTFTRKTYRAQVESLKALVAAVAAGKAPLQAIKADEVFLNAQARALRESLNYPGVKVIVT